MNKKILILGMSAMTLLACNKAQKPVACQIPDFSQWTVESYKPAFEKAIAAYNAEIEAIVANAEAPTFQNTIVALDRSGLELQNVEGVFFNLLETDGDQQMNEIAEEVTPLITECSDNIVLNEALFARVKAVYDQKESLGLTPEQARLLEVTYKNFEMNGANLSEEKKARLREINQELGLLSLKFGQNVVAETNSCQRFIKNEEELKGLPEGAKQAAAEEAEAAGHKGEWLFTPKRTSFTPVLQYCENRELRKQLLLDYTTRGNHENANDNKVVINKTLALRIEKAALFGYDCPADYILQDAMAHDGKTARALLQQVWEPSLEAAKRERAALQELLDQDLPGEKLQPWDWWFYAEKLRKQKYDLDEEQIKPYLELKNVRKGVFDLAHKLWGITIEPKEGMAVYHPDVEVFVVKNTDGGLLGYFLTDYFPRDTKRPGAWMNNMCPQFVDDEGVDHRPVIVNVGNFNKPTAGKPSLLSMDDAETLFHEFGHALHGLLTECTYQSLSGTNVPRDFVELPSQLMENWCYAPEVMKTYAFHYETGEVMPDSLMDKIVAAGKFNQGFVETELLSAAILDMDYHMITFEQMQEAVAAKGIENWLDVNAFEESSLYGMGMIPEIIVRYRSTFYNHIFTTGYEAGYYSYTWSAVLDSDAFHAFVETGDLFNQEVAAKYRKEILSRGNTEDPAVMYRNFRGKDADAKYLLEKKGL
ncbi:MAG: M3 family metallopeptidase [Paludibacteraceae bacterium]|nr:M3 family metallopeptidase [Paludibacteraceae bacterium]